MRLAKCSACRLRRTSEASWRRLASSATAAHQTGTARAGAWLAALRVNREKLCAGRSGSSLLYDAPAALKGYSHVLLQILLQKLTKRCRIGKPRRYSLNWATWCAWRESNPCLRSGVRSSALEGRVREFTGVHCVLPRSTVSYPNCYKDCYRRIASFRPRRDAARRSSGSWSRLLEEGHGDLANQAQAAPGLKSAALDAMNTGQVKSICRQTRLRPCDVHHRYRFNANHRAWSERHQLVVTT